MIDERFILINNRIFIGAERFFSFYVSLTQNLTDNWPNITTRPLLSALKQAYMAETFLTIKPWSNKSFSFINQSLLVPPSYCNVF